MTEGEGNQGPKKGLDGRRGIVPATEGQSLWMHCVSHTPRSTSESKNHDCTPTHGKRSAHRLPYDAHTQLHDLVESKPLTGRCLVTALTTRGSAASWMAVLRLCRMAALCRYARPPKLRGSIYRSGGH